MRKIFLPALALILCVFSTIAYAQTTVNLTPSKDNAIFSNQVNNASGLGRLYAGRTCNGSIRRALLQFDLSTIPSNATITEVTLTMNVDRTSNNGGVHIFDLHALTREWGEGNSTPAGAGGNGAAAIAPDATWNAAMFGSSNWSTAGGDFAASIIASKSFTNTTGGFTFLSTSELVSTAQDWLDNPASNFGIMLKGGESSNCSARRFGSKNQGTAPVLSVTYTTPCFASSSSFNVESCESYTVPSGDETYTDSGVVMDTIPNSCGADSVMTITVTIKNNTTGIDVQEACDSFTWIDGITYTASTTTPTFTLTNAANCDSIVTLNLTIKNSTSGTDIQTACESFTWIDGITYTASTTTPTFTLTNSVDCDSVVTLNLTINNHTSSTDVQTACESFTWIDGITYTESTNTPTFTLTNAANCDSIVTLNLTITPVDISVTTIGTSITANATSATYQWLDCNNNFAVISGETSQTFNGNVGTYAVEITQNGCTDTSACITITSLEDELFTDVSVGPNPSERLVSVHLAKLKAVSIHVYSLRGKLIYKKENITENVHQFELQAPKGVYILEVGSLGLRKQFKLLKD